MRHRSLTVLVVAAAVAVTASACTVERHWGGSSNTGGNGKAKVGLVTKTDTNPYFVELRNAARAAASEQGAYVKAALAGAAPKLLMVDGTAGSTVDTQRHGGFLKGIGLADGAPQILGRAQANGDQSLAQQGVENLLQRTTDINAVYTMN